MRAKYKVITLCGSTRFKDDFERINKELTLAGHVVISVGCFGHAGDTFTEEQKVMLDDIHKQKIDMADGIYVINILSAIVMIAVLAYGSGFDETAVSQTLERCSADPAGTGGLSDAIKFFCVLLVHFFKKFFCFDY